jgi:hypothetical protein
VEHPVAFDPTTREVRRADAAPLSVETAEFTLKRTVVRLRASSVSEDASRRASTRAWGRREPHWIQALDLGFAGR